jgi:hypothetical protein
VDHVDILVDEVQPHHYKEAEDLKHFKSEKTGRGPLENGWKESSDTIMCSYKSVEVRAELWMLQARLEEYAHKESTQTSIASGKKGEGVVEMISREY